jgi:penicillin-binding protein 2
VQLQPIPPKRGLIYDRNGVLLAENIPSYSLTVVKEQVEDFDQVMAILKGLVTLSEDDISSFDKRLARRRPYEAVPLKFKLTEAEIAIISVNRHRLPGVDVEAQLVRHYPHGEMFAHALGYVGRINERELQRIDPVNYSGTYEIGKIGLEKYYEDALHGLVGSQNVETNARGRVLRVLERSNPTPGSDLILNLDAQLQKVAYDELTSAGDRGAVVAIDPKTGGVLVLVSTPSFDSNLFVTGISSKDYAELRDSPDLPLFNRALQGQYPPASTLKPMLGMAGLHYGVVTGDTKMYDPGWYRLPNEERRYRDWNWKRGGHGASVDLELAIVESCDVYFYDMAYKLGIDRIHEYLYPFGFGHPTGIDNTNERSGLLPSREWKRKMKRMPWFPGETVNLGIGQGYLLATPLQLAVSTAALASRGEIKVPRMVKSIDGAAVTAPQLPVIAGTDDQWQLVIDAMEKVVHSVRGTAHRIARGAQYKMAGKTGTAQVISIAEDDEYDAEQIAVRKRDHALFVAFAPIEDPQIVVALIVENGEHGGWMSPIARKIFDAFFLQQQQHKEASEAVGVVKS